MVFFGQNISTRTGKVLLNELKCEMCHCQVPISELKSYVRRVCSVRTFDFVCIFICLYLDSCSVTELKLYVQV